ncbi:MAG: hypothetical protein M3O67_01455, partial [Bacteroidota bacterium]|nr:hypothetical protein [Bacteroidota bacterium]
MKKIFLAVFSICVVMNLSAQDRFFARVYNSNILPKGDVDLEFFHTSRFVHTKQFFHAQDQRMEIEFGLGKNMQTAFYFNRFQKRFSNDSNGTDVTNEIGFSNEWKWKLTDPSANKLGFALYGEWGIKGGDDVELETKVILDKYFGNNLIAFNGVLELEKEFVWENGETQNNELEKKLEFDLAYLYFITPRLGLGVEFVNYNKLEEGLQYSVVYGGPTISFRNGKWFVIANYM